MVLAGEKSVPPVLGWWSAGRPACGWVEGTLGRMGEPVCICPSSKAQPPRRLCRVLPLCAGVGVVVGAHPPAAAAGRMHRLPSLCRAGAPRGAAPRAIPLSSQGATGCCPPCHPSLQPVPLFGASSRVPCQQDGPAGDGAVQPQAPPSATPAIKPAPATSPVLQPRPPSHKRLPASPRLPPVVLGLGAGGCGPGGRRGRGSPQLPAGRPAVLPGAGDGAGGSCGWQLPAARAQV